MCGFISTHHPQPLLESGEFIVDRPRTSLVRVVQHQQYMGGDERDQESLLRAFRLITCLPNSMMMSLQERDAISIKLLCRSLECHEPSRAADIDGRREKAERRK